MLLDIPLYRPLQDFCRWVQYTQLEKKLSIMGGGGGTEGSDLPAPRTLHSPFPPPSIAVPASVCFSYCEIFCQCCENFPISSPPPALDIPPPSPSSPASRRLPSLITPRLPPPVHPPPPHNKMRGLFMRAKSHKVKLKIIDNRVFVFSSLINFIPITLRVNGYI